VIKGASVTWTGRSEIGMQVGHMVIDKCSQPSKQEDIEVDLCCVSRFGFGTPEHRGTPVQTNSPSAIFLCFGSVRTDTVVSILMPLPRSPDPLLSPPLIAVLK